jgi:pimeloyl-ACP methyl ester carboxylesterase
MPVGDLATLTGSAYLRTGVRMHYYDAGEGSNALILLHGSLQTSWQRRHVIEPFAAAGYHCSSSAWA